MNNKKILILFLILTISACSASVSYEKPVQKPISAETTFLCNDQPSSAKQNYCEQYIETNKVSETFYAGAVFNNAGCNNKQLRGTCTVVLTNSAQDVLYQTEVPLATELDSCMLPPEERKFLCHLKLDPKQLEPADYKISFVIEDAITKEITTTEINFLTN